MNGHHARMEGWSRKALWLGIAVVLVAGIGRAQRTWIVDAANGAGADFTDLAPAIGAARAGDTILLRPRASGWYNVYGFPPQLTVKTLKIIGLGLDPVPIYGSLDFRGTDNGWIVLSNLELSSSACNFEDCPGLVIGHRLIWSQVPANGIMNLARVGRAFFADCSYTRLRSPGLYAHETPLWLQNCSIASIYSERLSSLHTAALDIGGANAWVMNTQLVGGVPARTTTWDIYYDWGIRTSPTPQHTNLRSLVFVGPGSRVVGAPLPITNPWCRQFMNEDSVQTGRNNPWHPSVPDDYLVYDPLATFVGCRNTGGNELVHEFPMVLPGDAQRGRRQDIRVWGPTSSIVAVFASFLPPTDPIPLPIGDVWLDPYLVVHIGSGAVDANRRMSLSTTIPTWIDPGKVLVYQAASLSPAQLFELSPPGIAVVR